MPTIDRNGIAIHFEVHGAGPAILLTHGYSATLRMWDGQVEALAKDHSLILWDMRGHGQSDSPQTDSAYSEALTIEDMAALLDHLRCRRAVVGGLSLGGYMSLAFHVRYPQRVRALLIIDTGPGYRHPDARAAWNRFAHETATRIEQEGEAALSTGSPEIAKAVHKDLRGVVRAGRTMLTQHDAHVIDSLPDIRVPTLVMAGANDEPFLNATSYMAKKIPGARKVLIPNAGHAVNVDRPAAFNLEVRRFLEANGL
jgi:pimeloyl-ACP methyl ester carboxylesterase